MYHFTGSPDYGVFHSSRLSVDELQLNRKDSPNYDLFLHFRIRTVIAAGNALKMTIGDVSPSRVECIHCTVKTTTTSRL
jgi:hypothetical protein